MNANEIAEELESISWIQGDSKGKPFQHYANFVRQQQVEIEALRNQLWNLKSEPWGFDRYEKVQNK